MKSLFKNFIFVLTRFRVSSIFNILGLTVAFAAFVLIVTQVNYERNFEECHSNKSRIYRVDRIVEAGDIFRSVIPRGLVEAVINSSPQIEAGTLINPHERRSYIIQTDGNKRGFQEDIITCYPQISQIFDFDMVEGDANCLSSPQAVLLPRSMARRIFGDKPALGQQLLLTTPLWTKPQANELTVGGVYNDFPDNTQLNNVAYTAMDATYGINNWGASNYFCYVLLKDGASPDDIVRNFNASALKVEDKDKQITIDLMPLSSIYYLDEARFGLSLKSGNGNTPIVLLSIALLIILIAAVNFTNFSMTLAPVRAKNINIRKVLGGSNTTLRIELIGEAVLTSLLAFVLSLVLVYTVNELHLLPFIKGSISILDQMDIIALTLVVAILTGIIAGIRPAFYITSFQPAMALKGSLGFTPSGRMLRTFLVGFQFLVSIILVTASMFIYKQNKYIDQYSLGYDTDQIAIIELNKSVLAGSNKATYITKLKDNKDIIDVAFSGEKFGASDAYRTEGATCKGEDVYFTLLPVSHNFLEVMNIPILAGRTFSEEDANSDKTRLIINKKLHDEYNVQMGDIVTQSWRKSEIIVTGMIDDIQFRSLRNSAGPLGLMLNDHVAADLPYSYIRIRAGADITAVMNHIKSTVSDIDTAYPTKIEFYDSVFEKLYKQENNLSASISMFSLLAIIISVVGVFGLVMFECQYRRREISVRKVLGSSEAEIVSLFNRSYLRILAISFVLSVPLVYFSVDAWLNNFAYKTPLSWWIFPLAAIPVLLIIVFTVSWQSYRAALANPAQVLKSE